MDTLISVDDLAIALEGEGALVFDCRFSLQDPDAGRLAYAQGHIPGAIWVDTNSELSAPRIPGLTGRHPLPSREAWMRRVASWGLEPGRQAVMYDDAAGAAGARMWWMLRWIGHARAAVLDGGWQAWLRAGLPVSTDLPSPRPSGFDYAALSPLTRTICAEEIDAGRQLLLDARDGARFRGEAEPVDPVAGHIPGAHCSPFAENLTQDGHFKSPARLREKFAAAGVRESGPEVVSYCGSGLTATHNILAMKRAGLPEPLLYPGSWSEWITNPRHDVATGET